MAYKIISIVPIDYHLNIHYHVLLKDVKLEYEKRNFLLIFQID